MQRNGTGPWNGKVSLPYGERNQIHLDMVSDGIDLESSRKAGVDFCPPPSAGDGKFLYTNPLQGDRPLEETPLRDVIDAIARQRDAFAPYLRELYEVARDARNQVARTYEHVVAESTERRKRAIQANKEIDGRIAELRQRCSEETGADREFLTKIDIHRWLAERTNAVRFSRSGRLYVAGGSEEDTLLPDLRRSNEEVAAILELPYSERDALPLLPLWVAWAITILIGGLIGLALAALWHWPPFALPFAFLVGVAILHAEKILVRELAANATGLCWTPRPPALWLPWTAVTLAAAGFCILADASIQTGGFLAWMRQRELLLSALPGAGSAGETGISPVLLFVAACFVSFAFILLAAAEGHREARHRACLNRIIRHRENEFGKLDSERRAAPVVQDALASMASLHAAEKHKETLKRRVAETEKAYEALIAAEEAKRPPIHEGLTAEEEERYRAQFRNYLGVRGELESAVAKAAEECELPLSLREKLAR